jgi:hypothetical protein
VAIGWLVADLLIVFVTPYVGRAPLAMLPVFAVAAAFAYISGKRPQLAALTSIGGLVALLGAYGGTAGATDVYGPYSTVCYMVLALGVGWLSGRLLWPATASQLFRQRFAVLFESCLGALRASQNAKAAGRGPSASDLIRSSTGQFAQLSPLHEQARYEPVERALDPDRRARLLALTNDLVDAVVAYRGGAVESLSQSSDPLHRPLVDALRRADAALETSMQASPEVMQGTAVNESSELAAAQEEVEQRLQELAPDPQSLRRFPDANERRFLVELDARRKLVARQRAIEDWFAEWQEGREAEAGRA